MEEGPYSECSFPSEFKDDTPLIYAAYNGHEACAKSWIEAGADVNAANKYGDTRLEHAPRCSHLRCLKMLIEAGADVNVVNNDGEIVLCEASLQGCDQCVDSLIRAGANVKRANTVTRYSPLKRGYNFWPL